MRETARGAMIRFVVCTVVVLAGAGAGAADAHAQSAENVAVVINDNSPASVTVGEYYAKVRALPSSNVFRIRTPTDETIDRATYLRTIEQPVAAALSRANLQDRVLYIVLTKGVPIRVNGTQGLSGTMASVDSELTLLYRAMTNRGVPAAGPVPNPYFLDEQEVSTARAFTHREHDIFLVSRLDAYTTEQAIALIDRASSPARNGSFILDQRDALTNRMPEDWLALASKRLAAQGLGARTVLETTPKPARGGAPAMGYFSWASTDPQNRVRTYGIEFVPGALAASFVRADARTFQEPPPEWIPTGDVQNRRSFYAGSPDALVGDLIKDGVTGVAGSVAEPLIQGTIRPQILFPAYAAGFNLVESFYLAIANLSWQTIVIGDPLCAPFVRKTLTRSEIEDPADSITGLPAHFSRRVVATAASRAPGVPERAVALGIRAELLGARDDVDGARRALTEALELAPQYVPALLAGASLDERQQRFPDAIDKYRRVLAVQPEHPVALNNLAYGLAERVGMPDEALPYAKQAAALAPNNPGVLDTLAWVYHLLGDNEAASKIMTDVIRTDVANAEIRLHAAIIFAATGDRDGAREQLDAAVKLDPALAGRPQVMELRTTLRNQP